MSQNFCIKAPRGNIVRHNSEYNGVPILFPTEQAAETWLSIKCRSSRYRKYWEAAQILPCYIITRRLRAWFKTIDKRRGPGRYGRCVSGAISKTTSQ